MYLIDSDILIYLGRGQVSIQERMIRAGFSNCAMSEISQAELYVGAYKRGSNKLSALLAFMEATLSIIPISNAVKTYAKLRAQLELEGCSLKDMDLFIAATALANDYTLVTHNTRHFSRIPGLKLEDWMA